MNSGYCGVCGRRYSECVCGSRPYPRSGLDSPVRVELIAVPRERIAALERVAEAARDVCARYDFHFGVRGGLAGAMPLELSREDALGPLRKALQDLGEAPGEKERET